MLPPHTQGPAQAHLPCGEKNLEMKGHLGFGICPQEKGLLSVKNDKHAHMPFLCSPEAAEVGIQLPKWALGPHGDPSTRSPVSLVREMSLVRVLMVELLFPLLPCHFPWGGSGVPAGHPLEPVIPSVSSTASPPAGETRICHQGRLSWNKLDPGVRVQVQTLCPLRAAPRQSHAWPASSWQDSDTTLKTNLSCETARGSESFLATACVEVAQQLELS